MGKTKCEENRPVILKNGLILTFPGKYPTQAI